MHVGSPWPNSIKESSRPDYSIQSDLELTEMIEEYERIKSLYRQMGSHLKRVETKIKELLEASLDKSAILLKEHEYVINNRDWIDFRFSTLSSFFSMTP